MVLYLSDQPRSTYNKSMPVVNSRSFIIHEELYLAVEFSMDAVDPHVFTPEEDAALWAKGLTECADVTPSQKAVLW